MGHMKKSLKTWEDGDGENKTHYKAASQLEKIMILP